MSDLHIGIRLYNRDLSEDQRFVFHQIRELALREKPDAVVIAGDIYDRAVPSAEAVELFDEFLSGLIRAVPDAVIMMISGNHDSAPRLNCYRGVLSRQQVHMIGLPPQREGDHIEKVTLRDVWGPVHFYLLPFVRPSMVKLIVGTDENGNNFSYDETLRRLIGREEIDASERNVLVSHQFYLPAGMNAEQVDRMDSEIRTVGDIDAVSAGVLADFDYAALGHIHKPMKVGSDRWRYCGTPMPYSVSEAGQQKGIPVVEMREKGSVDIRTIPLEPLHQIRVLCGTPEEVLAQSGDDYVRVVVTGQMKEGDADLQDRLRAAFPNLLEIRRQAPDRPAYRGAALPQQTMDPFTLCCSFLKDIDEEEKELLRDIIETVQQGQ